MGTVTRISNANKNTDIQNVGILETSADPYNAHVTNSEVRLGIEGCFGALKTVRRL